MAHLVRLIKKMVMFHNSFCLPKSSGQSICLHQRLAPFCRFLLFMCMNYFGLKGIAFAVLQWLGWIFSWPVGCRMAVGWRFVNIFENTYGLLQVSKMHLLSFIIVRYILLFSINMYQSIFVLSENNKCPTLMKPWARGRLCLWVPSMWQRGIFFRELWKVQ